MILAMGSGVGVIVTVGDGVAVAVCVAVLLGVLVGVNGSSVKRRASLGALKSRCQLP